MTGQNAYDPHPAYRPEIDGLRAIAVSAVVLYHFSVPGIGGGLVGVDIFFVISGFLIGGILWREQARTGHVDLKRFFLRRIRRLAPAFFAMAFATLVVGAFVLLPFEFRAFGKGLIATVVYLANVHFYRETGYFDIGAENKVLLHNWSLAVEEQFYLVLPALILLLRPRARLTVAVLWGLFAASLAACIALTPTNQSATFYLFPFRAWELLAGVLLAVHTGNRAGQGRDWMSWAGLVLMLGGIALVQPGAGFPGWQVAVPVLGAVLAIAAGRAESPVNRVLSSPAPVFLGRISYSLYLWHWPVLTLSLYARGGHYASGWEAAAWMALAFALAALSWRYVEVPVRQGGWFTPRRVVAGWLALSAAFLAAGLVIWKTDGAPFRFPDRVRTHIDASADFLQDWTRCLTPATGAFAGIETCPIGPDGTPQALIWGDSHLRALKEGLERAAWETGTPASVIWVAGCPPLFGLDKTENTTNAAEDAACRDTTERVQALLTSSKGPHKVLLVGRWSYYAEGTGVGRDAANTISLSPAPGSGLSAETQAELFTEAFTSTLRTLHDAGRDVYVLRQPPEIPDYDSRAFARETVSGRMTAAEAQTAATVPRAVAEARAAGGDAPLRVAEVAGLASVIDPWPFFCDDTHCTAMPDGRALYFDNNHVTNSAGIRMRALFAPLFGVGP